MKQSPGKIGFSQRVRLEWMEQTASYVLAGMSDAEVDGSLQELLRSKVSVGGNAERGNREKIITILRRIWLPTNDENTQLRQRGLSLFQKCPKSEHLVLHWGMTMAAYPFWGAVAEAVGRLLDLQGSVTAAQAQRRLRERYGERETVARAARRVMRCFIDWGVLLESESKGSYLPSSRVAVDRGELAGWLIEALLHSTASRRTSVDAALRSPALFPFSLPAMSCDQLLSSSPGVDIIHRGLDAELISVKRQGPH